MMRIVQKIDVLSKSMSRQKFSGAYSSTIKGRGLTFNSIRRYEIGDDTKDINWNATARFRETYINTFIEDKDRLVWIIIDVSGSSTFGTNKRSKLDLEIEIAATLAYSSIKKNDAVGIIFFSDKIEGYVYPAKGIVAFGRLAKQMVSINPCGNSTDLYQCLDFLIKISHKRSLVILISDFMASNYAPLCKTLCLKHELMAIRIYDEKEYTLPKLGWIRLKEAESKREKWVNTRSVKFKNGFQDNFKQAEEYFQQAFCNNPLNTLAISTGDNPMEKLLKFMDSH